MPPIDMDLDLGTAFTLGVDSLGLIIAVILLYFVHSDRYDTQGRRYLAVSLQAMTVVIALDIVVWLFDGVQGDWVTPFLIATNTAYCWFEVLAMVLWARFIGFNVMRRRLNATVRICIVYIPMILISGLLVVNLITGVDFIIDRDNVYQSGPADSVVIILLIAYLVSLSGWILVRYHAEPLLSKRNSYLPYIWFTVLPSLGFIVQFMSAEVSVTWTSAIIAALIVYISLSRKAISRDELTGLNNRGGLDIFLDDKQLLDGKAEGAFILMDMDNFKTINDLYGHDNGDRALQTIADLMRKTAGGTDAFLARYGGDEFVAVLPSGSRKDVGDFINRFRTLIAQTNRERARSESDDPVLAISIGCALLPNSSIKTVDELIHTADRKMYEDKRTRKAG